MDYDTLTRDRLGEPTGHSQPVVRTRVDRYHSIGSCRSPCALPSLPGASGLAPRDLHSVDSLLCLHELDCSPMITRCLVSLLAHEEEAVHVSLSSRSLGPELELLPQNGISTEGV